MKRILALAMLAVGLMLFVCFAAAAEETTVTGRIFEGEWVYATVEGSVQINVIPAVDSYLVQVTVNTDGYEREFALDYICALDTAAGSLISEPGAVMYEVFRNDDYDVVSQEEVYSDGSAVFSLDEAGQLIWHDGKKDEDVTLERPIGWIDPDYIGPGHHFVGIWEEERVDIEIEERMEDYTVFISGSDGASEGTVWGYLCQYDPETDSLVSMENAGYKIHYWFSDTDEYSDELVYENGSAVFTINRAGLLIWEDQTEDAGAGRLFEKVPEEGEEGLYADIQTVTDSPAWVTDLPAAQDPQTMQLFVIAGMGMDQTTAVISMHQRDEDGSWKQILLRRFDRRWASRKYLRYSDDMYCFMETRTEAETWLELARNCLKREYMLDIADEKSGVVAVERLEMLGYRLRRYYGKWKAEPLKGGEKAFSSDWTSCALAPLDRSAWLSREGELAVEEANLYFLDEDHEKHYYPLETLDTIHVLNRVRMSSGFFQYADSRRIRVCFYDRFGNYVGDFVPARAENDARAIICQAIICEDEAKRLKYAIPLLQACLHNMRFVLRHYRKNVPEVKGLMERLAKYQDEMEKTDSIKALMLIEARAWQTYYAAFPHIMPDAVFHFENRNRRPPRDPINALLSFGNVVLYNRIATEIHRERLEISLSFLHAAESGRNSLSLDMAEVYKPLIVDRAIFALVNRKELRVEEHFMDVPEGGIYMNQAGKRVFLKELNDRLFTYMTVGGKSMTWQNCIRNDVAALKKAMLTDGDYHPYRH